ncbi:N-acetylglucosamine-specific PTS transporter subunit IIBC [Biostraticola tofi]|uniref:PTS system N-acetylglucosamine-specific IIA component (Glc family) /PTS system N-acetylglucosamine-specific IIB component (Glc family) /PTS system N-acetylglucosamine-specific IIC component (Glc fa... n=1 Tax=Biostraticola tofi TaxID=466109 RepID=A0A4R3YZB7_9GAMM|nr:N-acetylglucosamine-specific PTS transporter subunit IIBC [Biostraticola tofi]TCV97986.1 PTS system N-acetylglucosamine-specific IIA component (Glc family) /PTS system N-acetylglucosamine-specific IIB component (Glc family) /PTS system N-acetylglucosamine-specific IIC component (Glc family) [Biostraticola tofi]
MSVLSYLQKIGRALMVPVATLPAAAILMGIGYAIDPSGWGSENALAAFLIKSGSAIIENMSVLFAIGVAYGMSRDKDGAAALSGFVGFLVVTTLCAPAAVAMIQRIPLEQVPAAFGKINTQFVGILVGIISAEIYNRYSQVELPRALAFFSGRRLVPILVSFVMIVVSFILMYIWPAIYNALVTFGEYIQQMGSVGAGIYAFFNRLLIPVGLHHALNSVFWFNVAGINDIPNFLGGQQSINAGTAIAGITGRYQAGFFPVMMFGLPGAALAIYHCARVENKAKIASLMIAAGFASFFTGITEPLEFSFMFVAPVLYLLHAILTGISVFISAQMHWIAGFGFSAGLVDMLLSVRNPLATQWYMLIPQGVVFFILYYLVFRFTIKRFNLLTPGRELQVVGDEADGYDTDVDTVLLSKGDETQALARRYISAIGGSDNLTGIDACITRLRLNVKDSAQVNESLARNLGAQGVIRLNKESVQIIVGTRAEIIASAMRNVLAAGPVSAARSVSQIAAPETAPLAVAPSAAAARPVVVSLMSPITGDIVTLEQVPDEAFASKAVGEGVAIRPTAPEVLSPANGTLVKVFGTHHAFCLETDTGAEVIVHIGIDTVMLNGQGFTCLVEEGSKVTQGQPILMLDLEYLTAHAQSLISPVVIANMEAFGTISAVATGKVIAGQTRLLDITAK